MNDVGTQTETNPPGVRARLSELTADVQRGFVAEWAVTIILLLFGTTTLVQAFVIPSASMEGTLLIGDHVLVDKMVSASGSYAAMPRALILVCAWIVFTASLMDSIVNPPGGAHWLAMASVGSSTSKSICR